MSILEVIQLPNEKPASWRERFGRLPHWHIILIEALRRQSYAVAASRAPTSHARFFCLSILPRRFGSARRAAVARTFRAGKGRRVLRLADSRKISAARFAEHRDCFW